MTIEEKFWSLVERRGPDECWLYRGGASSNGYGGFWRDGKSYGAHCVAYEFANNVKVPKGKLVRHTCDVRLCCNPAHLLSGTHKENTKDIVDRGRYPNGARSPRARLLPDEVLDIWHSTDSLGTLAHKYNVTKQAIWLIKKGRNWAHITGGPTPH